MVTTGSANQYNNGVLSKAENYFGKSTDEKPTGDAVGNGSIFMEMDTSTIYLYDAEAAQWVEWGPAQT